MACATEPFAIDESRLRHKAAPAMSRAVELRLRRGMIQAVYMTLGEILERLVLTVKKQSGTIERMTEPSGLAVWVESWWRAQQSVPMACG